MLTNEEKEEKRKLQDRLKELKQKECNHITLRKDHIDDFWQCIECKTNFFISEWK